MTGRMRLSGDVAYEYLDDGGMLFCKMTEGAFWQLGPPCGTLVSLLLRQDGRGLLESVAGALSVSPDDAQGAVDAMVETLVVLGLAEPNSP